ncbi:MAG: CocE/NonD family hydrolase [Alphaproteobacteria bacterium]|nr:CocE/NonD family hydrolase [Alphaproteobacteria bacterium]
MQTVDDRAKTGGFQVMVPMRDGTRLNTFVFLPGTGGPCWPVILHRTPYGIAAADTADKTDVTRAWLPNPEEPLRGSILRGWRNIVAHGYAAVYQDTRGRHGSEGEDRVYADDAADGEDTLDWIAGQPWCNHMVGMSGSSAGATTTFAAASTRHPTLRAFFAQAGASSIYEDVVYEGQLIEIERLWLWVARNIPRLSSSHRDAVMQRWRLCSGALCAAGRGASDGSAIYRVLRLDAVAVNVLSRFRDLAAFSRRNHHAPGAGRVSSGAQFPPHDRDPRVPRHDLVRCLPNQCIGGVQRHPVAHRQSEAVDRPQRASFRLQSQFLAARSVFRLVRLLAQRRADWHYGRAGGVVFSARLDRGPRGVRPRRLAFCRTLATAGGKANTALSVR